MSSRRLRSALVDQRGIALPLALILLTLLTSLTLAFLAMSSTEPLIAANLKGGEQALALAEAALERAIWAMANPTVATAGEGTQLNDMNAIPAPYNFQKLFTLNAGAGQEARVFAIQISSGAAPNTVTAHGWVLRNGVAVPAQPPIAASDIVAYRKLRVQVNPGLKWPPGALTVAGTTSLSGNALVDGNDKSSGTPNSCPTTAGVTTITGHSITTGGSSSITGGARGPAPAQNPLASGTFNEYLLSDAELANIKALAQSQGTYVQPTSHLQFSYAPNSGLTFIDTVNGAPLGNPPDALKLADVKITSMNTGGWLIVMGSVTIDGNAGSGTTFLGFIYAKDNIIFKGTGSGGGISGAMISENVVTADTSLQGNSKAYYNCDTFANGGGTLSGSLINGLTGATVVSGSWQEVSGP